MLRQANKVKRIIASGGGDLQASAGKSLLVRAIYAIPSTNDTYLTCRVDRVTVAFYRIDDRGGNNISPMLADRHIKNMMEFLASRGVNISIPIAEGQTLTVSRYAETGNVIIVYDEYDAGDIQATMPNGSAASEYVFMQYMSTSQTPTASQDVLLNVSLSPAEFPDFPAGKVVPANHEITLLGLAGTPFTTGDSGPNAWGTSFIKLVKEREVLFDDDRNGIPFDGQDSSATSDAYGCNFSLIGDCVPVLGDSAAKAIGDPLMFEPPIVFSEGAELNAYLSGIMTTAAAWEETMVSIAAILKVKRS